jgi:hypothetical protein
MPATSIGSMMEPTRELKARPHFRAMASTREVLAMPTGPQRRIGRPQPCGPGVKRAALMMFSREVMGVAAGAEGETFLVFLAMVWVLGVLGGCRRGGLAVPGNPIRAIRDSKSVSGI